MTKSRCYGNSDLGETSPLKLSSSSSTPVRFSVGLIWVVL